MGLVWELIDITLESALCDAWHMGARYSSSFLPLGWGVTALQGKPLHLKTLLSSGVVVEVGGVSTCGLGEGQTLSLPEMDQ